jgi:hypothetical protein
MTLRTVAYVSAVYDFLLAVPLLLAPSLVATTMGLPPPQPAVNAQLNGIFALALAVGYLWAARDPDARRGYFWIAGVLAKGLGPVVFVTDHLINRSPSAFLAFAVTDGALALLTLAVLLRRGA